MIVGITRLTLRKEELAKLTPKQRKRYLMMTCFLRDMNFLHKHLLYVEKFTIEGARKHLKAKTNEEKSAGVADAIAEIHAELKKLKALLDSSEL